MLSNFCAVGIGHRQLDISDRSRYAFSDNKQLAILDAAKEQGIEGLMVLSTCNRSEFYAFGCPLPQLYQFFIQQIGETTDTDVLIWQKQGLSAIEHLLFVASSLDSQILGDLQIINQIKRAWQKSQEKGLDHPKMNRWFDHALRLNKQIKTHTNLSHGAASAAYAGLQACKQWLKHHPIAKPKILLLGMGEIGRSSCLNISKHLPQAEITITNRTYETAATFGERYQLSVIKWEERLEAIRKADIIVVGTAAKEPILLADMLLENKEQLLLDLSVPLNIEPAI
ncbi:MAG: NAD(P)-binding domain-containing protein, partial [Bacteroidota bacterium]